MEISRPRYTELDGYRGLAALAIVAYHAYMDPRFLTVYPSHSLLSLYTVRNLDAAVACFFVLSGFVLGLPFARAALHQTGPIAIRTYLARRARRIVPLYYVVAFVVCALGWRGRPGTTPRDWGDLAIHLAFAQLLDASRTGTLVGPAWSLVCEVQYYLLLAVLGPPAYMICRRLATVWARTAAVSIGCASLAGASLAFRAGPWHLAHPVAFPLEYLDLFAFGLQLAVAAAVSGERTAVPRGLLAVRALSTLVCIAAFVLRSTGPWWSAYFQTLVGLAFALLLATTVLGPRDRPLARLLGHRALTSLGAISYGIYLWHQPLLFALAGGWLIRARPGSFPRDALTLMLVSGALATMTYWAIERPALRWQRRRALSVAVSIAPAHSYRAENVVERCCPSVWRGAAGANATQEGLATPAPLLD